MPRGEVGAQIALISPAGQAAAPAAPAAPQPAPEPKPEARPEPAPQPAAQPEAAARTEPAPQPRRTRDDETPTVDLETISGTGQVLGTDATLLGVLDERLREALRAARVRELDALVLAAAGSSDARANATVARLARLWGARHHLPTSVAFASAAPPSTGEAVREFRRAGRRHVAVGSLFIAPGFLPDRAEELALEAGAVAVSAPLGAHTEVSRLLLARYQVGALQLVEIPA